MRSVPATCVSAILLATSAPVAMAHHGWGNYDPAQVLTLTGTIKTMTYSNPHGTLTLEASGKTWTVTLAPPFRMQNRGLPQEALKEGATVTVVGYPNRNDASEMRAERITVNDQTTELR